MDHLRAMTTASAPPLTGEHLAVPDETAAAPPVVEKPHMTRHTSSPATILNSPIRHHRRTPSTPRIVKETLNASLQYDDDDDRLINQYAIKQEIGRGSFGSVHLGVDPEGNEYAIKEFSKSRLRKHNQSNILRRGPHAARLGGKLNSPMHRRSASDISKEEESGNPLYFIQKEVAVMKKLNHENVVNLIEVLDDPEGDSLYMVLEMCSKGVIMKVGIKEHATPLAEGDCRYWFRDMILGIEYLHAQGIIHRDIKPDNLLLSKDDVLKIVDFGVSEMFEKDHDMRTSKSAGSPAFLPPEMCVVGLKDLDGKAVDIWSMGVSLYCFYYGHLPFDHSTVIELYESIKNESPVYTDDTPSTLRDLFTRIFEKDPSKRIKMTELREHPWVTNNGEDTLLSEEENITEIQMPTDEEIRHAVTRRIQNLLVVVKAINSFKRLVNRRRKERQAAENQDAPGDPVRPSIMPLSLPPAVKTKGPHHIDKGAIQHKVGLGIKGLQAKLEDLSMDKVKRAFPSKASGGPEEGLEPEGRIEMPPTPGIKVTSFNVDDHTEVAAEHQKNETKRHEILASLLIKEGEPPFLDVGAGVEAATLDPKHNLISTSPAPTHLDIYEIAYQNEVERIQKESDSPTVYSTNKLDIKKE